MKKAFLKFLLIAAAVLLATSCSKDDGYERNVVVIKNTENNEVVNNGAEDGAPEKVTITFNVSGGTGTAEPQTVEKGSKITLPNGDGLTKKGYEFLGWSLTENGNVITEYTATDKEVTLYAVWEQVIFTVTFDTDGGTGTIEAQTIEKGKTATEPTTKPSKEDYVFMGWYNGETEYDFTTTVRADITLKAAWLEVFVDLGLPSGLLWTTCNIGANRPEECGDYYAWGKSKTVATEKLGSDYRMPTIDEWQELLKDAYTYNEWTYDYAGNNVAGRIVYKKKESVSDSYTLNDTHIFLPAAGSRDGSSVDGIGFVGNYWSSTPHPEFSDEALYLYFDSRFSRKTYESRSSGLTVRAVRISQN